MAMYDAIIIGAGQAGLAAGYYLQQTGLRFLILEASGEPGGSWPHFYDSLALNTPARYSSLPGLPFPGHPDHYPRRDEVVAYLRTYAAHFSLPIVTGARVTTVERSGRLFHLITAAEAAYESHTVVAATGFFSQPYLPNLPGQAQYRGQLLHAAAYRNPEPFRRRRVIIIGGANAAVQIGVELAQVAHVTLATRAPIRYMPQRLLGRDIHFWLQVSGLDRSQWLDNQSVPVYDAGNYRPAIAANRPERKPMFKYFTEDGVVWSDGRSEAVDAVIFATGYRPSLAYLTGLGALDEAGQALQRGGVSTVIPGLYYVGLPRQRNFASATLRGVGADASVVVAHVRRYSQAQPGTGRRPAPAAIVAAPEPAWLSRGSELIGLIGLVALALKQQLATQKAATPRLVGQAVVRSLTIGAGFLGFGHAATLYARS